MKKFNIDDFIGGWFVGNFSPSIIRTKSFEAGVKKYSAGDVDAKHVHKIATEITYIAKGSVKFNDVVYSEGDIIILYPNDVNEFRSITDSILFVLKAPSVPGDKFVIE